jgi:hypothetical protein
MKENRPESLLKQHAKPERQTEVALVAGEVTWASRGQQADHFLLAQSYLVRNTNYDRILLTSVDINFSRHWKRKGFPKALGSK